MNSELQKIRSVYRRELVEIRSSKTLTVFGLLGALQCLLMIGNQSPGRIEDTYLIFMLGGFAAVIACFDIITKEREHRTLDLLLTQGITRRGLFLAKWAAMLTFCLLGGTAAFLGGIAGSFLSGKTPAWGDWLAEYGMTVWLLAVYGALSLVFSAATRRGKWALASAAITWFVMRPAILGNLVLGPISRIFEWSKSLTWYIAATIPEFAFRLCLDRDHGAPDDVNIATFFPFLIMFLYLLSLSTAAWLIFQRQDEPAV